MKGGKTPLKTKGYTIVEVMIVLAVSGMMFVMAATFINGKQQKTAFNQGTNELGSRIQKVADDVTNGHYSDVPLSCPITGGQATASYDSSSSQGTQSKCVFLGKLVHFYAQGTGQPAQNYEVISVADNRKANDDVFPRASIGQITDLTTKQTIPQGLELKNMEVTNSVGASNTTAYSIGFKQGAGSIANALTGEYKSGAQTVGLVFSGATQNNAAATSTTPFGTQIQPARSAKLCITDGKRYAQILIGGEGNGSQLSIRVKQLGETAC